MRDERIVILAWGNPGRKDDGAAWAVAERLRGALAGTPGAQIHVVCQLAPELAEDLGRADRAIFIDAHVEPAGKAVAVRPLEPAATAGPGFNHTMSPGHLLALSQALYGRSPQAWLVTVRAHDLSFGETLSPATAALIEEAAALALELARPQPT